MNDNLQQDLDWFRVQLICTGLTEAEIKPNLPILQEELESRPYIRNPKVWWDVYLAAEITIEGLNAQWAESGAHEAFWDSIFGTLNFSSNNIEKRINVLGVERVDS